MTTKVVLQKAELLLFVFARWRQHKINSLATKKCVEIRGIACAAGAIPRKKGANKANKPYC